ncbi:MAG: hypothetical protein ABJA82_01070 [Myxococcales bacterium]
MDQVLSLAAIAENPCRQDQQAACVAIVQVPHATLDVFFLADVGMSVQSPLGGVDTMCGVAAGIDSSRDFRIRRSLAGFDRAREKTTPT